MDWQHGSVAVRVDISATNVSKAYPLIAIFKQQANVLSFPLPLIINERFMYDSVSRTLCPSFIALDNKGNNSEQIFVELSSATPDESHAPSYHLRLDLLHNFELALYQKVDLAITPSEPQYYLFNFPDDIDSVIVRVHSNDKLCMTVSVQTARCPVADILDTVKYSGVYQTVTTLGAMTVNKLDHNITKFLVVLVLKPEDFDCGGLVTIIEPGNATAPRIKNITLTVTPSLAGYHYYLPIYGAIGIYVMFYLAAAVIILVYRSYDKHVRYYSNIFSVLGQRNSINSSPPPPGACDSQILSASTTAYTYLPTSVEDGPITRDRRAVAPNNGSSSTLTSTNVSTSYQRIPPPPLLSHSLFSSSSSSDVDSRSGSIQLQEASISSSAATKRKPKKFRRLPLLPVTSQLQGVIRAKQSHRRSMSYGSTREMGLRAALLPSTSGEVVQQQAEQHCSACSRASLGGGTTVEGGVSNATRGPLNGIWPLPTVRQVEEGLEASVDMQIDEEEEEEHEEKTKKNRHLYLQHRILFVSDLSRKRYSTLDRKYLLYFWYLIIISIFYGLPVAQLVMTYQRALHDTGNEDICYYNFECAHPLGVFTAFNNIISNIGYVMLGLLFLGLTARRDLMHRRSEKFGAYYTQDPYTLRLFCRWLFSRVKHRRNTRTRHNSDNELGSTTASNSAAANIASNLANGLAVGRSNEAGQQPPASPNLSIASSTTPMITITRSRERLGLCPTSIVCCTCCCCCQKNDRFDRHSSADPINDNPMLGAYYKDHQSNDEADESYQKDMAFGIPQHYGLFYAMGLALTMEGLLSACYHICPSFSNFQFDTAYMYILALILMLKIYQTRHPDINASAHSAYMVMAVVILAGVTGVLYGGETFWVIFTIVFLTMSIWLTAEIYYMGQWNFDICLPRRLYHLMRSDGINCLTPMYMERMLLLLVANCVNIGIAAFGLFTRPRDFASFLLSIFMINLLMYYCFYVIMKCRYRERFHCIPLMYIFLACITWGFAIFFFIQHSTTWEVTPAQSRALNQPCIFLGFYDVHDVWHFLSSTSMFFSFMSIMTLDDDLINTPRHKIPVF
nr:SID1 transmembrane family [Hymenolepis microstoma]